MIHFIDFYKTVFDGDAYQAREKDAPADLARFLYPDVAEAFRMLANDAVIVTSAERGNSDPDVAGALASLVRITILFTAGKRKADYLAEWPGYYGGPAVFVDDRPEELAACTARFPAMKCFEMRRDGKEGDGRWPVIRSLTELL